MKIIGQLCFIVSSIALAACSTVRVSTDYDRLTTFEKYKTYAWAQQASASGIAGVTVEGLPAMWYLRFDDRAVESRFLQLAVENGVLFKRGAYNFASLAHDEKALLAIELAASGACVTLIEDAR